MRQVDFGFILPGDNIDSRWRNSYVDDVKRALSLISGHFDSAWLIDHLQFGAAGVLEGVTALTYFAGQFAELRFGNSVLCQSFRNPAHLAKMGATLQYLSGGRFVLGLGAGWHEEEYVAYGYEFPGSRVRVEQLDEAIQIIRALWVEPSATTFEGQYHRVKGAYCVPQPQPVPPIMIGAFKPRMLALAAKHADWWNVSSTGLRTYRTMVAEVERACERQGRDPATLRRTWGGGCVCQPTEARAKEVAGERYGTGDNDADFDFVGTPRQLIEQMQGFVESGVTYFMLDCGGFPDLTTLELLSSEVLPGLRRG